jgi:hypothetical protein
MPANTDLSTGTRAGVRKPPKKETAGWGYECGGLYRYLAVA